MGNSNPKKFFDFDSWKGSNQPDGRNLRKFRKMIITFFLISKNRHLWIISMRNFMKTFVDIIFTGKIILEVKNTKSGGVKLADGTFADFMFLKEEG